MRNLGSGAVFFNYRLYIIPTQYTKKIFASPLTNQPPCCIIYSDELVCANSGDSKGEIQYAYLDKREHHNNINLRCSCGDCLRDNHKPRSQQKERKVILRMQLCALCSCG